MKSEALEIKTGSETTIHDLTEGVGAFVKGEGDGFVNISLPHATAGLAILELGAGSEADLVDLIDTWLPKTDSYSHSHGSRGHGRDHLLPAIISPTLTLPVFGGRVSLGTWQRIALVDTNTDNPNRRVLLTFLQDR